jgi:hypothetical protein
LKANSSRETVILRLLRELVKEDIQIIAIAVDQRKIIRAPKEAKEIYRKAVSRAVHHLVARWPRIEIYLDQRYTNSQQRYELEKRIREEIFDLPQKVVLIRQLNSQSQRGLQAADFIAWAFFQKYEKGDCHYVDILEQKIVEEEVIGKKNWRRGSIK